MSEIEHPDININKNNTCDTNSEIIENIPTYTTINGTTPYTFLTTDSICNTETMLKAFTTISNNTEQIILVPAVTSTIAIANLPIITYANDQQFTTLLTASDIQQQQEQHQQATIEYRLESDIESTRPSDVITTIDNSIDFPYQCNQCNYKSTNKFDYEVHRKTHLFDQLDKKPNKKTQLPMKRNNTYSATNYMTNARAKNEYHCKICRHCFTSRMDLCIHEKIHQPLFENEGGANKKSKQNELIGAFTCSICFKRFKTVNLLHNHTRNMHKASTITTTTTTITPSITTTENQSINKISNINGHFKCNNCSLDFSSKVQLNCHSRYCT